MKLSEKVTVVVIITLMALAATGLVNASPPYPTTGTATIDGDYAEWDLTNDFFSNMNAAFDPSKPLESKLYLRYNPGTETLYVLILTVNQNLGLRQPANAWFDAWTTTDSMAGKELSGDGAGIFAWVEYPLSDPNFPTYVKGWEGSFYLPQGEYQMKAHIQVQDEYGDAQTSGTLKAGLDLLVIPEGPIIALMISMIAAIALIFVRKRKNP